MAFDPTIPAPNTKLKSAEMRSQFNALKALIDAVPAGPTGATGPQGPAGVAGPSLGALPIGGLAAWCKDFPGTPALPAEFAECNGQVLNDPESPYDGMTLLDLNGAQRFLRGAMSSGGVGGSATHHHSMSGVYSATAGGDINGLVTSGDTDDVSNVPPYYDVVFVMRVK